MTNDPATELTDETTANAVASWIKGLIKTYPAVANAEHLTFKLHEATPADAKRLNVPAGHLLMEIPFDLLGTGYSTYGFQRALQAQFTAPDAKLSNAPRKRGRGGSEADQPNAESAIVFTADGTPTTGKADTAMIDVTHLTQHCAQLVEGMGSANPGDSGGRQQSWGNRTIVSGSMPHSERNRR